MRIIFPLLFPWLSRGPKTPWTWFPQCMFSWLASWSSEASGVALLEICGNNKEAACPAHVSTVTTLLCQLPGAVGEPQPPYLCWPPFLPEDICCVQVPVWPCPPSRMSAHCRAVSAGWTGVAGMLLNCLCGFQSVPVFVQGGVGCWGFRRCPGLLWLI